MTQEQKELLIKDLCARLPYGVKVHAKYIDTVTDVEVEKVGVLSMVDTDTVVAFTSDDTNCYNYVTIQEVKPYLRPMSSMTGVEVLEYISLKESIIASDDILYYFETYESIDWLNKNHFDYRGLIEKGLAIDATNLNIYGYFFKNNINN